MKFSDMKLHATNAVRAYFIRNWTREDLMNSGEIPEHAHTSLKTVYLTLFCTMWSFTFGSFLHLIWEVGGRFTVLSSVASFLCLYFTSPLRVRTRVSLLIYAACTLGASFDLFTKYLFDMNLILVVSLLAGPTLAIGTVWLESLLTRERSDIYMGCLTYSWALMFTTFVASTSDFLDSHAAHWMLKVCIVLPLFLGYLVAYSQEIVYDAHFGEINFVNRTLTIFFHLPGIVVHAARLCLGAEIEQHRQN
ncbi:bax inhibitor 1-like [Solanum dulcamara]|uniref:bax inhibitor 1-like n=1 Tax=Solanum dulcamara TaxID=45834 RepID=UPI002486CD16|nr:bax inhibitor 1-like [Solanum dulcamara]